MEIEDVKSRGSLAYQRVAEVVLSCVEAGVENISKLPDGDWEGLVDAAVIRHTDAAQISKVVVVGERQAQAATVGVTNCPACDYQSHSQSLRHPAQPCSMFMKTSRQQ